MANQFNPLDPLGVLKKVRTTVDGMATRSGLPTPARIRQKLNGTQPKAEDRSFARGERTTNTRRGL